MDWRAMFEGRYLGAWNLIDAAGNRRDMVLTIARVEPVKVVGEGGKTNLKPVIYFAPTGDYQPLPMVLNKTNGKTVSAMYSNDTREWVGKRIRLYGSTTEVGGKTTDCLRVRPGVPEEPKGAAK